MRIASEPITKYYLVNYDSVNQEDIDGIETLNPSDNVVIFYIDKQHTMELSFFERIHSSSANIQFNKVSDESLYPCIFSAYIGYIMGSFPNAHIYIISHDNRYEFLKEFWSEKYEIFIEDSISNTITENPVQDTISEILPEAKPDNILSDEIEKVLQRFNLSTESKIFLRDLINKAFQKYLLTKNIVVIIFIKE